MKNHRNSPLDKGFRHQGHVPVRDLNLEDSNANDDRFDQHQRHVSASYRAHDFTSGIFNRDLKLERQEWLILRD